MPEKAGLGRLSKSTASRLCEELRERYEAFQRRVSLVWAVLDLLITHETNGIRFNQLDRQRLERIRYQGADTPRPGR